MAAKNALIVLLPLLSTFISFGSTAVPNSIQPVRYDVHPIFPIGISTRASNTHEEALGIYNRETEWGDNKDSKHTFRNLYKANSVSTCGIYYSPFSISP